VAEAQERNLLADQPKNLVPTASFSPKDDTSSRKRKVEHNFRERQPLSFPPSNRVLQQGSIPSPARSKRMHYSYYANSKGNTFRRHPPMSKLKANPGPRFKSDGDA